MADDPSQRLDDRIGAMSEELEERFEKLRRRITFLEADLERKISDLEYAMDRLQNTIRDLERKAERGY